jgi:PIN domain nuclease of toxin-antitoxin system
LRLLLDTHALLWHAAGDSRLPAICRAILDNDSSETYVSAVSAVEIAIKVRIGKLPSAAQFSANFENRVKRFGFRELPVSWRHGRMAGAMPGAHRDPFDRILIAQALVEDLILVTNEALFDGFGVQRLW